MNDANDHGVKATERVASAWRWDDELERLADNPALLDGLPPAKRVALGLYLTSKAAADKLGVDVTGPNPKENR